MKDKVRLRLFALNLALLTLLVTSLAPMGLAAQSPEPQEPAFLIVDGKEYDPRQNYEEDTWSSTYHSDDYGLSISLRNYHGGSIHTNFYTNIHCWGENVITDTSTSGFSSQDSIYFFIHNQSSLTVTGGQGHPAIESNNKLTLEGNFTVTGGGCAALKYGDLHLNYGWPLEFRGGPSEAEAQQVPGYTGQVYFQGTRRPYILHMDGNGGTTAQGQLSYQITTTDDAMHRIPPHVQLGDSEKFTRAGTQQLGWSSPDGTLYTFDQDYIFPPDTYITNLSAVWEDQQHKGIFLHHFSGYRQEEQPGQYREYLEDVDIIDIAAPGDTYILPQVHRTGYRFDGWLDQNRKLLQPGTALTVTDSLTFDAQFTPLVLTIDGQEYNAGAEQSGNGWRYYTDSSGHAQLTLESNYSGAPVELPCTSYITLHGSVNGTNGKPAITVHGDCNMSAHLPWNSISEYPLRLTGSDGAPAVLVEGKLYVSAFDNNSLHSTLIAQGGGASAPAFQASYAEIGTQVFWGGTGPEDLTLRGDYAGEHYTEVRDTNTYHQTFTGPCTIEALPKRTDRPFLGWSVTTPKWGPPEEQVWYLPGDQIPAGESLTLTANTLFQNRSTLAQVVHGCGGLTPSGSAYYVSYASPDGLELFPIPDRTNILREGYHLQGFTSHEDGNGRLYQPGESLRDDGHTLIYHLYAQWEPLAAYGVLGSTGMSWNLLKDGRLELLGNIPAKHHVWLAEYNTEGQLLRLRELDGPGFFQTTAPQCRIFVTDQNYISVCNAPKIMQGGIAS